MERNDQIYYQRKEFQQFENKCDNNINVNNAWLELIINIQDSCSASNTLYKAHVIHSAISSNML